tara:strand:+ start:1093 stop:1362 length:270 start_codon:yes stop_codon:yes gene_type:complete
MTDAPEKIAVWRFLPSKANEWLLGGWSLEHDRKTTEYTRTDVANARIEELEAALKAVIGMLDDPTGSEHIRDMRGATIIAIAALKGEKT